jgi:hypothetical protein
MRRITDVRDMLKKYEEAFVHEETEEEKEI